MEQLETLVITPFTVYETFKEFGYIDQLEKNLQDDPKEWESYRADPAPYLYDLMSDFANNIPEVVTRYGQERRYLRIVARNNSKGWTTKFTPGIIEEED